MRINTLFRNTSNFLLIILCVTNLNAELSLVDALILSSESGKNIYVEYTAEWCLPCQIFEESILGDKKISDLLDSDFILIKADYDNPKYLNLFKDYSVSCMPTQHILNSNGDVLLELSGTTSAAFFYEAIYPFASSKKENNSLSSVDSRIIDEVSTPENIKNENRSQLIPTTVNHNNNVKFDRPEIVLNKKESIDRGQIEKKITATGSFLEPRIKEYYVLQVGAFSSIENAKKQKQKIFDILNQNIDIVFLSDKNLYTVHLGRFQSLKDLAVTKNILKQTGIDHFVKRKKV